jgi:ATP-dependent Clp protease ATP-binding subunit ClpA
MSLLSRVSHSVADADMPFLLQVDFADYARKLETIADGRDGASAGREAGRDGWLSRYVGLNEELAAISTILTSAGVNGVWIEGEAGSGKTALAEEFIRARAGRSLGGLMAGRPFFLFDVSRFLIQTPANWVETFSKALALVSTHRGLVIIDNIDDLVKASGESSDRLMHALLAALAGDGEGDIQCVIVSRSANSEAISSSSTGIRGQFQSISTREPSLGELKPMLMAHFSRLGRFHDIDYSEPVADEIIRLLGRYPGRAFTASRRPENAIAFADKVGARARLNVFAEPAELAELRDQIGALSDAREIAVGGNGFSTGADAPRDGKLADLRSRYEKAHQAYQTRLGPVLRAKQTLGEIEGKLSPLDAKGQADRTPEERQDFNTLTDGLRAAREGLARAEKKHAATRSPATKADVRGIFSEYSGVPIASLSANKLERLAGLEASLSADIFCQEAPVKAVTKVWRERELGVSDPTRPAGVLLFTGGTGLGKTELTKALARWDGGESAMPAIIRMSELKDRSAVTRLTGAAPGLIGFDEGAPTMEQCESKDIVVFDEIDKADPSIYDVVMQILEEGEITLSNAKVIRFRGKLIVITANAVTAKDLTEDEISHQDEHQEGIRKKLCQAESKDTGRPLFRPEFIGRIDEVYVYRDIDSEAAMKILKKDVAKVSRDYQERGISIEADDAALKLIIDKHYVPSQGGRSPRQIVKKRIRPIVTDYLMKRLSGSKGDQSGLNETLHLTYEPTKDVFGFAKPI